MRILSVLSAVALVAGCTEYELGTEVDTNDGVDTDVDTHVDDTDEPSTDDCEDQVIPGYVTSADAQCENEVETGTFTPVVEWYQGTFPTNTAANQIMSQPIVASVNDDNGDGKIDGDDIPDIIVVAYGEASYSTGGVLRAISGDGSGQLWSVAGAGIQGTGGAAAGDLDGDGLVDIVALTPNGAVAFTNTGTIKWSVGGLSGHIYGTSDVPAISDMNGDGLPEIIAGRAILNGQTGALKGAGTHGRGGVDSNNVGTCAFAVDLDGDGFQEVITGNATYKADGTARWYNGLPDGYPAVADFDGDGQGEIAVSGQGQMRLLDTDGTLLWQQAIPGAGSNYYGGPPTIADFDGDGEAEIGVAAGSRYSVFEKDGTILWQAVTDDSSSGNTGSAVFDFEGDGVAEVVYADQSRLWVFNGTDGGVKLASTDHSNGTWLEYPTIADVDGDDHAEIVVPNTAQYGSFSGFHVFGDADDSWRPGRKIWNQHAYHITNVEDDGGIPAVADLNWMSYNSFRSGDVTSGDGLSAPDLTLAQGDICEIDCDEDRLVVWVHAGNEGATEVRPEANPKVRVYGVIGGTETLIDTVAILNPLPTGKYLESVQIDISGMDVASFDRLIFRIESDEQECDPYNNDLVWDGPFCD